MDLDPIGIIVRLALGLIIGFSIGLTGVGGGVLVVPALAAVLGFPPATAVGTASTFAFLTKIYAAFEHYRIKTIAYRQSLLFLAGAIPGSVGSTLLVKRFAQNETFQSGLGWFIIGTITFSGVMMLIDMGRKRRRARHQAQRVANGEPLQPAPTEHSLSATRITVGIGLGLLTGCLIGATSVGGGVIVIHALLFCFGLPNGRAIGSSIFIALALTLISAVIYYGGATSQVDLPTAILMVVGSVFGVAIGSRWSARLSEQALSSLVVAMIVIAIVAMVYRQLFG
jgi:uncharacterized membrane protein YfcA